MHPTTKLSLIFLAIILASIGFVAISFAVALDPHNYRQPQPSVKRGIAGMRRYDPVIKNDSPGSYLITSSIPATSTSSGVQPLATTDSTITPSINIYSSFTMGTLTTLTAARGFQNSAIPSSSTN